MATNRELQARKDAAMPRGFGNLHPVYADRARDAELWDVEGNRYIDFTSGIAVLNTGHLHPRVLAAVRGQLDRFSHTCLQVVPYESAVLLAERLNRTAPGPSPKKTLLLTTGAEAVENAIKIAKCSTRRSEVIAFYGGFHGRTHMGMALTGKVAPYRRGFGSLPLAVHHARFPMPVHGVSVEDALESLEDLFLSTTEPEQVAAIVVEPVQGEGGFHPASTLFMQRLRQVCSEHGIVLICDEVQTGFGRTGRLFAIEHYNVEPDLIAMAKGLAGGFPLAAVCGKAAIMDAPEPGGLGGTYAGSPLGTAAALAVLDVIEEEGLLERSRRVGAILVERLKHFAARRPDVVGDIRSLGAMVAMELFREGDPRSPAPELTKRLVGAARARGLLLLPCGMHGNVIRLLPPLTIPEPVVQEALGALEAAFDEAVEPVARAEALQ